MVPESGETRRAGNYLLREWARYLSQMLGEFPLGPEWAAQLFAAVLLPSRFKNVFIGHRDAVAAQLVRAVMTRSADLGRIFERVQVAYAILDQAFDQHPEQVARALDGTFQRLGELQEREFSLERDVHEAPDDALEAKFGSYLDLYEFTHEQYYRTLAASYVASDALAPTGVAVGDLVDADGRVAPASMEALEAGRSLKAGTLTEGLDRHLRNSAAHHRYSILGDDRIRLWDMNPAGRHTWGPVEWKFWDFRTKIYLLSNTCSVLLLGLAMFDIANGPTIRARGWGLLEQRPQPRRRDIVKSELLGMAAVHGFTVEDVKLAADGALTISLRVKGDTTIEQNTQIIAGGVGGARGRYQQHVRTEWGPLRKQVYGLLQTTFDVHGGYDLVRVTVVAPDGKTSLGGIEAPVAERQAMIHGKEPVEAISARLPVDTLADEKIPVIIKRPIVPVA